MYVLHRNESGSNFLLIYRSFVYMNEAIRKSSYMHQVSIADFTVKIYDDVDNCVIVKDRTGVLQVGAVYNLEKILKIIEILMKD